MLDCQFYGLKPWGHHLTSVILHSVNTALLFLALNAMTGAFWRSFFVAALFGWHPLHVESVAWVAERKDVLSTFFWLLMLLAYVTYAKKSKIQDPRSKIYYALALLFFALGLMSKPMVVTAPFLLLLLDYWPLGRIYDLRFAIYEPMDVPTPQNSLPLRKLIWEKVPFLVLAVVISGAAYMVQKNGGAMSEEYSLMVRAENAVVSYCRYLGKLIYPTKLAFFYPHPGEWPIETVGLSGLLLVAITFVVVKMLRRRPYLAVGWFWFVGTLVPVIGLVQVGRQAMADRYTYVPAIGIFIMVIWGAAELAARSRQWTWIFSTAGAALLIACCIQTRVQLSYWRDSETLNRHAVEVTTDNVIANANLGGYLVEQKGEIAEGVPYLKEALRLDPSDADIHASLGFAFISTK